VVVLVAPPVITVKQLAEFHVKIRASILAAKPSSLVGSVISQPIAQSVD
jgi:hypothetical protein